MTQEARPALVSIMTTQHFVMQSAIRTATTEAGARASIYMYSLSGCLVALGVRAQSEAALIPFIASVFPAILLLGLFTVVRLVDISIDHLQARAAIARIHSWYATLEPVAAQQFKNDPGQRTQDVPALRFGPVLGGLTTIASMVATINSIVFGAAIALAAIHLLSVPMLAGVAAGAAAAAALVAGFYAYQTFRLRDALTADTGVSQQSGKPPP